MLLTEITTLIKTDVRLELSYGEADVRGAVAARLGFPEGEISEVRILKRTLNIKDKTDPHYTASVAFSVSPEREAGLLKMKKKVAIAPELSLDIPKVEVKKRPVIVGAGPAGLFSALAFAEAGARPIVIERGLDVESRQKSVERFIKEGVLDPESNVQFGEGGAGAFSDGKLKYGAIDEYKMKVLTEFVLAGADESVTYSDSAHLGTDKLPSIIKNIREKAILLGAEFIFSARLTKIETENGRVVRAVYEKHGDTHSVDTDTVVLATGHSARDVFEMLLESGAELLPRPFGIGVRVEHPREYINELVFGAGYDKRLPTASYHLVTHLPSGRSVYSFCMCPGGTVVAAASADGRVVTNGMSEYARDGENSNSALLVSVTPEDFPSEHPLAGLDLQRAIEERAFAIGGKTFSAPAERMSSFMNKAEPDAPDGASYPRGTVTAKIDDVLPKFITDSLREAIIDFDKWMPGFYYPDALLTAPETRSTSPVRIVRGGDFSARGISGLYPVGEGAGYSGGIVSSAVDGLRCALSILAKKYS